MSSVETLSDQFPILYQNRYCDQDDFSIAVFGSENDTEEARYKRPLMLNNFDSKVHLPSVQKHKNIFKAIANGSDIYLTYQYKRVCESFSFMKYSFLTNIWERLPSLNEKRINFCVCSFMQKLFVIG